MIKFCKLIDIIPHLFIGRVENMCSILVHLNSFYFFTINISGNVISFFNHKAFFSTFLCFMCENCTKKSCSHNQIIVFHIFSPLFCLISPHFRQFSLESQYFSPLIFPFYCTKIVFRKLGGVILWVQNNKLTKNLQIP